MTSFFDQVYRYLFRNDYSESFLKINWKLLLDLKGEIQQLFKWK